jgi:hypothetical protein
MKYILIVTTVLIVVTLGVVYFNSKNSQEKNESISGINIECIITLFGEQYDVTQLRFVHPGGNIYECGTDMTETYIEQHGNDLERIEKYKVSK